MLSIFGENDRLVPIAESIDKMRSAFESNANGSFEYKVFKNVNHAIFVAGLAPTKGYNANEYNLAQGYFDYLFGWIEKTLKD